MSNKKIFMSVTATAAIASALVYAEEANASSYTVKQGDTLWSISQKYDTSVAQLKSWNGLSSDLIRVNQVLKLDKENTSSSNNSSSSSNSSSNSNSSNTPSTSSTYTVVKGDNLSKIAAAYGVSVKNLMEWNNLNTTLIFPGDKLAVRKTESSNNSSNNNATNNSSNNSNNNSSNSSSNSNSSSSSNSSATTYTVKSGDNLSKIAAAHGISLNDLKKWNSLTSHIIYPGDRLVVSQSGGTSNNNNQSTSPPTSNSNAEVDNLISIAKSAMGTKYTWGGASLSTGFDCSGFIHWAFNQSGKKMGRFSTDGYYNRSYIVNKPEVGDLVFFENTYRKGISHMGIYLGNNQFIHAGSSTGVTIANVNSSYWSKHFHSYKRFY